MLEGDQRQGTCLPVSALLPSKVRSYGVRGQNQDMTRYRPRAVLLLFLVLHLTACMSWQSAATPSPSQFIEAEQPDRVRVTTQDGTQVELENPSVEGDELVASGGFSMPSADVVILESRKFSMDRTVLLVLGGVLALPVALIAALLIDCGGQSLSMC